jgi:hypothetical protein
MKPVILPPSRPLQDRLTKVPDWFRPKNQLQETYAKETLKGMADLREVNRRRVAATKAATLPKAAEIVRKYDVRAKSFLGGKNFPWTSDSWERIQLDRFRKAHPFRYLMWRYTGLMAPTL